MLKLIFQVLKNSVFVTSWLYIWVHTSHIWLWEVGFQRKVISRVWLALCNVKLYFGVLEQYIGFILKSAITSKRNLNHHAYEIKRGLWEGLQVKSWFYTEWFQHSFFFFTWHDPNINFKINCDTTCSSCQIKLCSAVLAVQWFSTQFVALHLESIKSSFMLS